VWGQLQASASLPSGIKTSASIKQEASCGPGAVCTSYGGEKNFIAASGIKKNMIPGCQSVASPSELVLK